MPYILFVCTGNTCRSSMAEALTRKLLKEWGKEKEVTVSSAGLGAFPGAPATPEAVAVMEKEGIDLKEHRARQVTPEMVVAADIIFTMTAAQKKHLETLFPEAQAKTHIFKAFAAGDFKPSSLEGLLEVETFFDLSDPIGKPKEAYEACAQELKECLPRVLAKFLEEGGNR